MAYLAFCRQVCKMSMLAPTISAVRFLEVVWSTGRVFITSEQSKFSFFCCGNKGSSFKLANGNI